ncbi:MAG: tripartite tricarboxylate transporter permease [Candidatus Micrarchaeia archaeon]
MGDAAGFLIGFLSGLLGGLLPGLHSNTLISALASSGLDRKTMATAIAALFPAHIISSFIPAIFFGVPDQGALMIALPGQRMARSGKGILALKCVILSSVAALVAAVALLPATLWFFPAVYPVLSPWMGFVLVAMTIALLAKSRRPLAGIMIFILSGMLGILSFKSGLTDPFLPLFSGMFAMAGIFSYQKGGVIEQSDEPAGKGLLRFTLYGLIIGLAAVMVPGVGSSSQAAALLAIAVPLDSIAYLAATSSITMSQAVFSLATSASIGKSRVGATAWLAGFTDIGADLPAILSVFCFSAGLASLAVYALRKKAGGLAGIDFSRFNLIFGAYLTALTFLIDGPAGLLVLGASTLCGLLALRAGAGRTTMMGAIILPTLLLLFRIFI